MYAVVTCHILCINTLKTTFLPFKESHKVNIEMKIEDTGMKTCFNIATLKLLVAWHLQKIIDNAQHISAVNWEHHALYDARWNDIMFTWNDIMFTCNVNV